MAELICKDGTKVLIPDEIEQELRKNFGRKTVKHGDYGYFNGHKDDPCVVFLNRNNVLRVINKDFACSFDLSQANINNFQVIGNVFDKLN